MTPVVGKKIKVWYADDFIYTFEVVVTAICGIEGFIARVDRISAANPDKGRELTGGKIWGLLGKEMTFKNSDILHQF